MLTRRLYKDLPKGHIREKEPYTIVAFFVKRDRAVTRGRKPATALKKIITTIDCFHSPSQQMKAVIERAVNLVAQEQDF